MLEDSPSRAPSPMALRATGCRQRFPRPAVLHHFAGRSKDWAAIRASERLVTAVEFLRTCVAQNAGSFLEDFMLDTFGMARRNTGNCRSPRVRDVSTEPSADAVSCHMAFSRLALQICAQQLEVKGQVRSRLVDTQADECSIMSTDEQPSSGRVMIRKSQCTVQSS